MCIRDRDTGYYDDTFGLYTDDDVYGILHHGHSCRTFHQALRISPGCGIRSVALPVSYTHLDVYKRQSLVLSDQTPLNPANKLNNFMQ